MHLALVVDERQDGQHHEQHQRAFGESFDIWIGGQDLRVLGGGPLVDAELGAGGKHAHEGAGLSLVERRDEHLQHAVHVALAIDGVAVRRDALHNVRLHTPSA